MNDKLTDRQTAVRLPDSPVQPSALRRFVSEVGLTDTVEFLPKDDDELNQLACSGRFHTIVFASLSDLLTAIWKGDADWSAWRRADIRIELAEVPEPAGADWRRFVNEMYASFETWRKADRHRTIIAAAILSLLALLAAACLLWFSRPP